MLAKITNPGKEIFGVLFILFSSIFVLLYLTLLQPVGNSFFCGVMVDTPACYARDSGSNPTNNIERQLIWSHLRNENVSSCFALPVELFI